jgi:BirA family transcriptional regulator, biotin operon repressor / biotin---[acetyl-CoA-carboxylase] ligase
MEIDFAKQLRGSLKVKELGLHIHFFDKIESTQDCALSMAQNDSPSGTVIIAEKQSAGRGRMGKKWISPKGGLWMSIILQPRFTSRKISLIQFIGALAVGDSILEMTGIVCTHKWPNDILIRGKKVCGILVDTNFEGDKGGTVVVGIGLNANFSTQELFNSATLEGSSDVTTLRDEIKHDIALNDITKLIIEKLEHYYLLLEDGKTEEIIESWKRGSEIFGQRVTVKDGNNVFYGRALDLDDSGALLITLADGSVKKILFGEVRVSYAV